MAAVWKKVEDTHHSACTSLLPAWTSVDRGCLVRKLLVSPSEAWHLPLNVLHILQNASPSTQMGGPFVECVERTSCSTTVLVRCFLCQPLILCCSTSPKYKKESANLFPCSLLTLNIFAQLSHLVAVHHLLFCSHKSSWKVPKHLFSTTGVTCLDTHLVDLLLNCSTSWIWQLNHDCSTYHPLQSH